MAFSSKYGVARHIYINIPKAGSANHAVGADWTPSAGDVKISKDGGAAANVTNLPTAIAMGNSATWDFSLTATEMQAAQINVTVADSATKAVDDTGFVVETYGNASAQHAIDFADSVRAGLTGLANAVPGAAGGLFIAGTNAATTITSAGGSALTLSSTGTNGHGLVVSGNGSGDGIKSTGGGTGNALELVGGGTSGDGLKITTTSGHGMNIAATGTSMHGITSTGGNGGTSDGVKAVAGTGGVPIRGDITGNLTGNVSGSVGSVTGAVGSVTGAVGSVTGNVGGNVVGSVASVTGLTAATVHSDLDDIQARLPAALTGAGNMKSDALAIDGSTSAATHLSAHTLTAVPVTFGAGGSTTTAVLVNVDGAAASSTDDFYNGRVLIFTAPAGLKYQATDITDYVGATKTATITAVTAATDASTTAVMVLRVSLSGTQKTMIAVGGPGLRYAGFSAKSAGPSTFPRGTVGPFTRLAVGGPGLRYAAFIAKGEAPVPTGQVVPPPEPYGPARGWPLFRRKRCDKEHEYLCKEEQKLEKQLEKPSRTELQAKRAEERRASLELVKAKIAALQAQMDEDDFNDLMLIDELDDLED